MTRLPCPNNVFIGEYRPGAARTAQVRKLAGLTVIATVATSGCAPVVGPHAEVGNRMFAIAARYEKARREGGMAANVADIERCYTDATFPVPEVFALRDCLIYDYVAYQMDVTIGRGILRGPALPYFEDKTAAARWARYGHLAQFDNPTRLAGYLTASNTLVTRDLVQMNAGPVVTHQSVTSIPTPDVVGRLQPGTF